MTRPSVFIVHGDVSQHSLTCKTCYKLATLNNMLWILLTNVVGRDSCRYSYSLRAGRSGDRIRRSQWPCGLRRGSTAARLLGLWVRIPPGARMFVLCLSYKDGSMERKVTWRTKGFKQYKNWSKGKNPGQTKKNPGGGEIFSTRPDRPWGLPSLLYNGCRVIPGGKAAGAWSWPPTLI
jgi:hypothetical protein